MQSKPRDQLLAQEIARALGDEAGLSLYESYARHYPELFLRKIMAEVLDVPAFKIRKSRGALFTFLVHKYGQKNTNHHRA